MTLLSKLSSPEPLQYSLVLTLDACQDDRIPTLLHAVSPTGAAYETILRILRREDSVMVAVAARLFSVLATCGRPMTQDESHQLVKWVLGHLRTTRQAGNTTGEMILGEALKSLGVALRWRPAQEELLRGDAIDLLIGTMNSYLTDPTILYRSIFCLWELTFFEPSRVRIGNTKQAISVLSEVLRMRKHEKVNRVTLACLVNLSSVNGNCEQMIGCGVPRVLTAMSARKWDDEEGMIDMGTLTTTLELNAHELSSFQRYKMELLSGTLTWTPSHKSEKFWRQNCVAFEKEDYLCLRILLSMLKSTTVEQQTLAIACHDMGEFVRFHPRGREVLEELGGKIPIMALMSHRDSNVRKEALLATQKLLVRHFSAFGTSPTPL